MIFRWSCYIIICHTLVWQGCSAQAQFSEMWTYNNLSSLIYRSTYFGQGFIGQKAGLRTMSPKFGLGLLRAQALERTSSTLKPSEWRFLSKLFAAVFIFESQQRITLILKRLQNTVKRKLEAQQITSRSETISDWWQWHSQRKTSR